MKKFTMIMACFLCAASISQAQSRMALTGEGPGLKEGEMLYLFKGGDKTPSDSTRVTNGKFAFALKGFEPQECCMMQKYDDSSYTTTLIYLDDCPTNIRVDGGTYVSFNTNFMNVTVTGNPVHSKVQEVNDVIFKAPDGVNPFISEKFNNLLKDACRRADLSSAYILGKYMSIACENGLMPDVKACVEKMSESVKNTVPGQTFMEQYEQYAGLSVDFQIKDFTLNTVDGKPVNLMEYIKGKKLVLIDFWASWCAPCRQEGQNVKAIYEDYHAKGFDVLGVSLDTNKDAWVKAMKEEGYKWTQVSDLLGFKSPVVKDYEIVGIPALFLVDGNGKVVARDLRGKGLRVKVSEICK